MMDSVSFSVIGKHKAVPATNSTVAAGLLSRISDRKVDFRQPNEGRSLDSEGFISSTETGLNASSSNKKLVDRIQNSKLVDRIEPSTSDKGKHATTSRAPPPNVTTSFSSRVAPNDSLRQGRQGEASVATPFNSSRPPTHRKTATPYRPSAGMKSQLDAGLLETPRRSLSPMELETPAPQPPVSTFVGQPVVDSPPNPGCSAPETGSLARLSTSPTPKQSAVTAPVSISDSAHTMSPRIEALQLDPDNMDVDPVMHSTVGAESVPNSDIIRPVSPMLRLPVLVPITLKLPVGGADTNLAFSSPMKANDVTYDTLHFHMSSLWKETEAQAREWAEVADERAGARLSGSLLSDNIAAEGSITAQLKRGRECSSDDDITEVEAGHLHKRQRIVVNPPGISTITSETRNREVIHLDGSPGVMLVQGERNGTADEIQDRQVTSPQMCGIIAAEEITREGVVEEEEEEDLDRFAAEKRAADELLRKAAEKAEEMRKNLEQELAIQRREREREEQERRRKKEELESAAQRLRKNLLRRKETKSATLPTVTAVSKMQDSSTSSNVSAAVRHPLPPKPPIQELNDSGVIPSQANGSPFIGIGLTDSRAATTPFPNATTVFQSPDIPFPPVMPPGIVQGFIPNNQALVGNFPSSPSPSVNPALFPFQNQGVQWSSSHNIPMPVMMEGLVDQAGMEDEDEKKGAIRKEKKRLASQARRRRKAEEKLATCPPKSPKNASNAFPQVAKETGSPQSVPKKLSPDPGNKVGSEAMNLPVTAESIHSPGNGEDGGNVKSQKTSKYSSVASFTTPQNKVGLTDQVVNTSTNSPTVISPYATDPIQSSMSKSGVTGTTLTSTDIVTTNTTIPKLEPVVETVSLNKDPSPIPAIPGKWQDNPEEAVVVKRRDTSISMGGDLELPEITGWGDPEIAKEERDVVGRGRSDHMPTPPPVSIPLERLPLPQRESPSPSHGRQRSWSPPRSRSPFRPLQRPAILSREPQIDGARTPPREVGYRRTYYRHGESRSISPRRRAGSPIGRARSPINRAKSPINRARSPAKLYDSWRPAPPNRPQYSPPGRRPSEHPRRYIPRYSRSQSQSRSPSRSRSPHRQARKAPGGKIDHVENSIHSADHTSNISHRYSMQSSIDDKEADLRVWNKRSLKPYTVLQGGNGSLVPSPPPQRFPPSTRMREGRNMRSSFHSRDTTERPHLLNSEERRRTPSPPASSSVEESVTSVTLLHRVSAQNYDISGVPIRGAPRARGSGSPGARGGRPKLQDRLSDSNQLKDRIS